MTHQEIQQLIDRYLDGETTPAEELQLARALRSLCGDAVASLPADWQAVLLMLGELAEGEAAYDRIVAARRPKARVLSLKWPWAAASLAVAATLLLLFVFSHRAVENTEPQQPLIAEVTTPPAPQELVKEKPQTQQVSVKEKPQAQQVSARRTSAPRAVRRAADVALPDTLGDGIWQQKENVELALRLLADCEAAILRGEQEIRNNIIEATYRATPQPENAILVTNELGDYEVIETRNIIEI
jgi:hypothetical protein